MTFRSHRLDQANRNLRKTKLLAPYNGTIAWRSVQPNEEVHAGQKILEINATGKMEVELAVPETTIDRIHIDDPATITFPTLPGESAKGRISYIGGAAVKANAFPVKVELIDPNEKVKPGMTAEANLVIKDKAESPVTWFRFRHCCLPRRRTGAMPLCMTPRHRRSKKLRSTSAAWTIIKPS